MQNSLLTESTKILKNTYAGHLNVSPTNSTKQQILTDKLRSY